MITITTPIVVTSGRLLPPGRLLAKNCSLSKTDRMMHNTHSSWLPRNWMVRSDLESIPTPRRHPHKCRHTVDCLRNRVMCKTISPSDVLLPEKLTTNASNRARRVRVSRIRWQHKIVTNPLRYYYCRARSEVIFFYFFLSFLSKVIFQLLF